MLRESDGGNLKAGRLPFEREGDNLLDLHVT